MHRLLVFLIIVIFFYGTASFSGGHVGISSQCVNNNCVVSASTSLYSIILSLGFILFAMKFPRAKRVDTKIRVGVWRRFGAFFLDFLTILLALTPILTLPIIYAEYTHTGSFNWSFQRNFSRDSDILLILPSGLILFAGLIYYFYKFTLLSKPTLGQYVLGYRVVAEDGDMNKEKARARIISSILGMCFWPISVIHGLIKKRVFWWDSTSESIAVLTSPDNSSTGV